ncbi:MAG: aldo/keto reductase [Arachnia sp.]
MAAATMTLPDATSWPAIGVGTFGSDRYDAAQVAGGVEAALEVGFRLIDCAAVYRNEDALGRVVESAIGGGLGRGELVMMSKVWNDHHQPHKVRESVEASLRDLRVDYLDACFIHWPFPNSHGPGADVSERDPHARPFLLDEFMRTWAGLEELIDEGLVRRGGVSNITVAKLRGILPRCRIRPQLAELEHHPGFQQGELLQHLHDQRIQPVGYSPLGSPSRPERDRAAEDRVDLDTPQVRAVAEAHAITPAQVCLAWAINRGVIPIPFSVKRPQLEDAFAASQVRLTAHDMHELRGADRNNRLIKGHVFLWPGAGSWLDLWDVDGSIPGWNGYGS